MYSRFDIVDYVTINETTLFVFGFASSWDDLNTRELIFWEEKKAKTAKTAKALTQSPKKTKDSVRY